MSDSEEEMDPCDLPEQEKKYLRSIDRQAQFILESAREQAYNPWMRPGEGDITLPKLSAKDLMKEHVKIQLALLAMRPSPFSHLSPQQPQQSQQSQQPRVTTVKVQQPWHRDAEQPVHTSTDGRDQGARMILNAYGDWETEEQYNARTCHADGGWPGVRADGKPRCLFPNAKEHSVA
jgi:hypothetical protein